MNRIQKLLWSEYNELYELVLIESPFVLIARSGHGLNQLQIGLTSSKLIVAREELTSVSEYSVYSALDPETETIQLVSIWPLEFVTLSVFQRRRRRVMKVRLHDGSPNTTPKVHYFELAGRHRKSAWLMWSEKMQMLHPTNEMASGSEPSVASSTSLASISPSYTRRSGARIWEHYGCPRSPPPMMRNKQFGPYCEHRPSHSNSKPLQRKTTRERNVYDSGAVVRINRFGEGVSDGCSNELYLPSKASYSTSANHKGVSTELYEECATVWARGRRRGRWSRFAGRITPCPHLHHGAALLATDTAGTYTMLMKRSRSYVRVSDGGEGLKAEGCGLKVGVCSAAGFRTESCGLLAADRSVWGEKVCVSQSLDILADRSVSMQTTPALIHYFWTTDYWYKPDTVYRSHSSNRIGKRNNFKSRLKAFFGRKQANKCVWEQAMTRFESALRLDEDEGHICMWELDSDALSSQLTIIDTALFLRVPGKELTYLKRQGHARNCRNLLTWLTFSHRISCLTASQILLIPEPKRRARLIARCILVCEKCYRMDNHQSATSVLSALQSPAIYRLHNTWAHVRRYHSRVYQVYKHLCHVFTTGCAALPDLSKPPYLVSCRWYLDMILTPLREPHGPSFPTPASIKNMAERRDGNGLKDSSKSDGTGKGDPSTLPASPLPWGTQNSELSVSDSATSAGVATALEVLFCTREAARGYDLSPSKPAFNFLLKVPYHEHHANFRRSLQIEPKP